jgi:hypothetical protein
MAGTTSTRKGARYSGKEQRYKPDGRRDAKDREDIDPAKGACGGIADVVESVIAGFGEEENADQEHLDDGVDGVQEHICVDVSVSTGRPVTGKAIVPVVGRAVNSFDGSGRLRRREGQGEAGVSVGIGRIHLTSVLNLCKPYCRWKSQRIWGVYMEALDVSAHAW